MSTAIPADLVGHNDWATQQVLDYCQQLDDELLNTVWPGTYGSILGLLRHTINSEMSYLHGLAGGQGERAWDGREEADLAQLGARAAQLRTMWQELLARDFDPDQIIDRRGSDGRHFRVAAGVILAQAFHHASEHRAQICSILGANGHDVPDVSSWGYALATGRGSEEA